MKNLKDLSREALRERLTYYEDVFDQLSVAASDEERQAIIEITCANKDKREPELWAKEYMENVKQR